MLVSSPKKAASNIRWRLCTQNKSVANMSLAFGSARQEFVFSVLFSKWDFWIYAAVDKAVLPAKGKPLPVLTLEAAAPPRKENRQADQKRTTNNPASYSVQHLFASDVPWAALLLWIYSLSYSGQMCILQKRKNWFFSFQENGYAEFWQAVPCGNH